MALWCVQVWQEPSTSPLRNASGTVSVSPACSALCHWWDVASSPSVTTFCALTAGGTNDLYMPGSQLFPNDNNACCLIEILWIYESLAQECLAHKKPSSVIILVCLFFFKRRHYLLYVTHTHPHTDFNVNLACMFFLMTKQSLAVWCSLLYICCA